MTTDTIIKRMAKAYYQVLTALKPVMQENEDIKIGIKEGLGKFLSNIYIKLSENGKRDTDYYSSEALKHIDDGTTLIFEHIVPKARYIQEPCLNACLNGKFEDGTSFSEEGIENLLVKYWKTATVTKEEDDLLLRRKMPNGWQVDDNVFARYKEAKITLFDKKRSEVKYE